MSFKKPTISTLLISLAMIPVVFLMGCSTLLDDVTLWAGAADASAVQAAEIKAEIKQASAPKAPPAATPDIPPYVAKCIKYGLALARQKQETEKKAKAAKAKTSSKGAGMAPAASADALVTLELKTADEQKACAKAVLDYYRSIQKANQKAAAGKVKTS